MIMINQCLGCGKDYESKRVTSKYYGDSCRVKSSRSVTPAVDSVTLTEDIGTSLGDLVEVSVTKDAKIVDSSECSRQNTFLMVGVNKDINYGAWKPIGDLGVREVNRVMVPGDADYVGCRREVDGVWRCI